MAFLAKGKMCFPDPQYVRVAKDDTEEVIYVSDWSESTVTKLSMAGQEVFTYRNDELTNPSALVTADSGHLLVCGFRSHNIQVVSPGGVLICTMLNDENLCPLSACYDAIKRTLYVSTLDYESFSSKLQVYKLH